LGCRCDGKAKDQRHARNTKIHLLGQQTFYLDWLAFVSVTDSMLQTYFLWYTIAECRAVLLPHNYF
jgi:hypothetical protein